MRIFLLPFFAVCTAGQYLVTREMYDSISRMLTGSNYPTIWWEERSACLATLDPGVEVWKRLGESDHYILISYFDPIYVVPWFKQ